MNRRLRSAIATVLLIVLASNLASLLVACGGPGPATPTTAASTTGRWYEVYFTDPKYPDTDADHHGGMDEKLVAFLNSAQKTIDMAIYDLNLSNVADALLAAKGRGVRVRLVTDTDNMDTKAIQRLKSAGVPIVDDRRQAIMHNKFVVVDNQAVWTGSWNFAVYDTYRYNNNGVRISSPELAQNYTAEFEKMFVYKEFGPSKPAGVPNPRLTINGVSVENYFAPEDKVASRVIARIMEAKSYVRFMAFSFTNDAIGKAVTDRASAGVRVQGVFETTGSETRFSEYGKMKKAGLDVWQDGNPYLMHHKVFIIDDRTVIFGSFNFTANADEDNDENLLIVDDPALARLFNGEFDKVYSQAEYPVTH